MSPERDWRFRIRDMLDAIEAIQEYSRNLTCDEFIKDSKTVDAVIRRLMIIGEAASHIPEEIASKATGIEWQRIRGMRNFIVHEYFGVSEKIIWDTIQIDLPGIIQPLKMLIQQAKT
jgi:uncharacterized protein with HEPN domain